jgi:hypothetical protein
MGSWLPPKNLNIQTFIDEFRIFLLSWFSDNKFERNFIIGSKWQCFS